MSWEDRMKLLSSSVTAALVLGLMSASAVRAQDRPIQLRFSHWVPPTHPMHAAAVAWAESIDKASNGSIKIAIFPSQQLGRAFDHYNMGRDGIGDYGDSALIQFASSFELNALKII